MRRLQEALPALQVGDAASLRLIMEDPALLRFSLLIAAEVSSADVVQQLLAKGAMSDVEFPDSPSVTGAVFRLTPMVKAIRRGDVEIVRVLAESGALARTIEGQLALHRAAAQNNAEVVRAVLCPYINIDTTDSAGDTPLINACRNQAPRSAEALIAAGAKVNAPGSGCRTALMVAAAKGDMEITLLLLAAGADPLQEDAAGDTAIATAKRRGHTQVEEALQQAQQKRIASAR
jgi:ankyrin repeat protein